MSGTGKSKETESRLAVARGLEEGGWGVAAHGDSVSFWGDETFWNLIEVTVAQHSAHVKCHRIVR